MKITRIDPPRVVLNNPYSQHRYAAWPSITRLKNGRIALVASGFRLEHVCPFGKAVLSFSEDEGAHYTLPAPVIDTMLDDRDAGILAFGDSGVLVTSFNNSLSFQRGYAPGKRGEAYRLAYLDMIDAQSEAEYLGATFRVSFDNGVTWGAIHRSPVTSPHGPLACKDGTILWVGRTFSPIDAAQEDDCIQAYTLDPVTGKMEYRGCIANITLQGEAMLSCEPHAIELNDGTILCHIRVQTKKWSDRYFTTFQSMSHDGGRTWTEPVRLLDDCGGAPAHILRHSSGTLISVYGYRQFPYGIKAMFSRDGGKTWDTGHEIYINEISGDLGYPATVELTDGSLLTVFYAIPEQGGPAVIMQQKWRMENDEI